MLNSFLKSCQCKNSIFFGKRVKMKHLYTYIINHIYINTIKIDYLSIYILEIYLHILCIIIWTFIKRKKKNFKHSHSRSYQFNIRRDVSVSAVLMSVSSGSVEKSPKVCLNGDSVEM